MEYKLVIGVCYWSLNCFATGKGAKEEEICMRKKKRKKKKVVGDRQNVTEKRKSQKGGEVNFNKITRFEDLKV